MQQHGVGTATFYEPSTGMFASLGHGITDIDTGDLITISASPSPLDSKIQIGIIMPDKTKKYIVCTGKGAHAFTVSKGGNYKVFVKNCSKKKITVAGSYSVY